MAIVVPDGQRPPFAIVTNQDHGAWILIIAWLGLAYILLFGAIRVFVRLTINPIFGLDDVGLAASTATAIIQTGLILGACANGLGKSLDLLSASSQVQAQRMAYASTLFAYITLGLSKASVVLFLMRLSTSRRHYIAFRAATGVICAWTVASLFAMALQCELSHPWRSVGRACPGTALRLTAISAFDIITEVALVGLALFLVWGLQMSPSIKASIVFVFAFRLPMLVPIGFRMSNFDSLAWVEDPLLMLAPYYVWTQAELVYSVISATIPTLRPLIRNLNTQGESEAKSSDWHQ
ncbi:hypothetical protein DV736_g6123, partial [Chaetothyriales sp. CBS 134916]